MAERHVAPYHAARPPRPFPFNLGDKPLENDMAFFGPFGGPGWDFPGLGRFFWLVDPCRSSAVNQLGNKKIRPRQAPEADFRVTTQSLEGRAVTDVIPSHFERQTTVSTPLPPFAGLRCWNAGWDDVRTGLTHLVLAARETCGLAAPFYIKQRIGEWLEELDDDQLDQWADELLVEAANLRLR